MILYTPAVGVRLRQITLALLRWLASFLMVAALSAAGVFCLQLLVPGDPAETLLETQLGRIPTAEQVAAERAELGLDQPFGVRLLSWMTGLLHGDLGRSWATPGEVSALIWPRVGATLRLALVALCVALIVSMVAGIASALARGRPIDHLIRLVVIVLGCVPAFVLGVLVIEFVVIRGHIGQVLSDGSIVAALLPGALLGVTISAYWTRVVRSLTCDVLDSQVVRTARARGASWIDFVPAHVIRAVSLDFLPFIGLGLGSILGATTVVEVVFSWPGIGAFAAQAATRRDMPVLEAVVLLSILMFRLGTDAMRGLSWVLDPRKRDRGT